MNCESSFDIVHHPKVLASLFYGYNILMCMCVGGGGWRGRERDVGSTQTNLLPLVLLTSYRVPGYTKYGHCH